jgi:hypothetical protein
MIPEEQSPSPEDMRKVMRAMQVRMGKIALHHFERIGPRTFRALQDQNLITDETLFSGDEVDLAVLRDQQHPRREKLPDGPLVIYFIEGDEPNRMLIELPLLLFSDDGDIRRTVLEIVEKMLEKDPMVFTPNTVATLSGSRGALVSEAPKDWRPAAVAIYDSLNDDTLFSLHGIHQSLESKPVLEEVLNLYAPKVIYPSVTSLESISLSIGNPERDHGAIVKLLSDMVARTSTLAELCASYLANLGFLPLAPTYSMATAVKKWLATNNSDDPWQEVWGWAKTEWSPIARYHACSVFVLFPELIPEGKISDLWSEILSVVYSSNKKGAENSEYELWALRRDLARHYTYHLEARLPDNDGVSIGCFAWWFTEQVAKLFSANAASAKFYRKNWIKKALETSSLTWLAASAPIQRSFLRYITLNVQSPWALALLILMGEHMDKLAPTDQVEEVQKKFQEALVSNTLAALPFSIKTRDDPTFVLECSLADTVLKWAENQTAENREGLLQLIEINRTLGIKDGICNALQKLGDSDLPYQAIVCSALKTMVYTEPKIAACVWDVISDPEWRKKVLGCVEIQVLSLLIESLNSLLIDNRGKWYSNLPHYIAELCETEKDEDRRRVLFLYVIYTSLASDTVSALRRLLRGDQKAKFVDYVKEYYVQVDAMRSDYPPWVAGKLRGLMASMHIL